VMQGLGSGPIGLAGSPELKKRYLRKTADGEAIVKQDDRGDCMYILVEGEARVDELARMLAGTSSAAARKHAAELLADASLERSVRSDPPRRRAAKTRL